MIDKRAYTEVYYIINGLSKECIEKIPVNVRKNIEDKMDRNYVFNVNASNISGMKLLKDTEKILSVLYTDYFSTEEEKQAIQAKENAVKKLVEEKKSAKNNFEINFKNDKVKTDRVKMEGENIVEQSESMELVEYKLNIVTRIWNKIRKMFNR